MIFLVIVLILALAVIAGLAVDDLRALRFRRAVRALEPARAGETVGFRRPAYEDSDAGIVTYRQVAELLPRDVVDSIERALDGRRPVLTPEPAPAPRAVTAAGRRLAGYGAYSRVIVHHANGTTEVIGDPQPAAGDGGAE